jgi:hypothetical protein
LEIHFNTILPSTSTNENLILFIACTVTVIIHIQQQMQAIYVKS